MRPRDYAAHAVGHGCIAIDLDGLVVGFNESIRDALITRGELECRDGTWHLMTRGLDMIAFAPDLAICDFCSRRPVIWNVPCADFRVKTGQHSAGDWAACAVCGEMVRANDRPGLLDRAIESLRISATRRQPPLINVRPHLIFDLHRQFWKHYRGNPTRLPPRPFGH